MLITASILMDSCIFLLTLAIAFYFYIKHKYTYWTKRGLPQLTPSFPFGNYFKGLPRGINVGAYSKTYYDEFKKAGHTLGGIYLGLDPYLVVVDPTYAKEVLSNDFQYFTDRGLYVNEKNPLTVSLLTQGGNEWKTTRNKFTNMFTSSKMKFFFKTMNACSEDLYKNMETLEEQNKDIDIYEIMGCYFTDVIASVVFGVEANSFKQPDAVFRKMGRELFESHSVLMQMRLFLSICYPSIAKKISLSNIQPHIEEFFIDFIKEALEYRQKHNIQREDFMQLLINLRNTSGDLTELEMVSQAFLFFSAGFETSTATSSFVLYELAQHGDIQDKLRQEIKTILRKYNGEVTYESLKDMTFFDQVFNETTRKYPLLSTLNRTCVKDYKFRNSDVVIEKGTGIILPVLGYHHDPQTFPEPSKWDPDRFLHKDVKYEGYFPFGDGPRNCIGSRFGFLQVKLGLVQILKEFKVSLSPLTKTPLKLDTQTFVTRVTEKIFLKVEKIQ